MAIKRIITAEEYNKLSKDLKAEYKLDGDSATLDLTDYEDPAELKRAKDNEVAERKRLAKEAKELKTKLDEVTEERDGMLKGSIKKEDADKLEKSYKEKASKAEEDYKKSLAERDVTINELLVDNVASTMAREISNSPSLLVPVIKARLRPELVEGKYVTRVLDAEGKPTAHTVADLKKEFLANKEYAPILTGSKASGGAGSGQGSGGAGAGSGRKVDKNFDPSKATPKELAAWMAESGKLQRSGHDEELQG